MANKTGGSASLTFDGTTYGASDCIQDWSYSYTVDGVTYTCGNFNKVAAGAKNVTLDITMVIAETDTGKLSAFEPGSTATDLEFRPYGDTPTYPEITPTDAVVLDRPMSGSASSMVAIAIKIQLNDVTEGVAV